MRSNPFTSSIYESTWSKYFNDDKTLLSFDFIKGVRFLKNRRDGVYINAARNLTKGIYYELDHSKSDYKKKVFLIYDVPEYFDLPPFDPPKLSSLRLKKVYQYKGFLMDLSNFKNVDEYINKQFSSKNRREFRSNIRRLETCFNVRYEFINSQIEQQQFDILFGQFYDLLNKRFNYKQTYYHHLSPNKWNFYKELVYNMLGQKKASLLIIYNEETPIGITLNFHSDAILFETITVFDPDYYKFSIGKTSIIKLLEWCFENNYKISDFSKGDFNYKHKWGNRIYDFNYHILYDSRSIKAVLKALYVELYFKMKLFLRRRKVNHLYRKFKFMTDKNATVQKKPHAHKSVNFEKFNLKDIDKGEFKMIDYNSSMYDHLLPYLYSFAFANPEPIDQIEVYVSSNHKTDYIFKGTKKAQRITFS